MNTQTKTKPKKLTNVKDSPSSKRYTQEELETMMRTAHDKKGSRLSVTDINDKKYGITTTLATVDNRLGGINGVNKLFGYAPIKQNRKTKANAKARKIARETKGVQRGRPTLAQALRNRVELHDSLSIAESRMRKMGIDPQGIRDEIENLRDSIFADLRKF